MNLELELELELRLELELKLKLRLELKLELELEFWHLKPANGGQPQPASQFRSPESKRRFCNKQ